MGRTPDRNPGPSVEEELQLEDRGPGGDNDGDPTVDGALRRVGTTVRFFDGTVAKSLLQLRNEPVGFVDLDLSGVSNGDVLAYNSTTNALEASAGAGGGISETQHRDLDQLVHIIAETSFEEITRTGILVTNVTTWTDVTKTIKIRECDVVYTGVLPSQITTTQYDAAGTAIEIVVETITYSGFLPTSIDRVRTL